jgi:hypothetical protein
MVGSKTVVFMRLFGRKISWFKSCDSLKIRWFKTFSTFKPFKKSCWRLGGLYTRRRHDGRSFFPKPPAGQMCFLARFGFCVLNAIEFQLDFS